MAKELEKAPVTVLLGAQWGDEGKGKIIDYLIFKDKVIFFFEFVLLYLFASLR